MKTRKVKIKKADRTIDKTMDGWRDECMDMDIFLACFPKYSRDVKVVLTQ